ncbi:MAG: NAD-dependent epimerase/dehydratase family protein, partial [Propionibacteriaceae bacterium]|nr:NAD-dependent epimerase/dehydratase family protein [Propionibacteriaceae bacterium]
GAGAGPADPRRARGPYARSKAAAEQVALGADGGGLSVVAIRPHLVWGPADTQLIGRVVERARTGRLPLIGSGAALIDSTYISNAVDALLAALDRCNSVRGQALVVTNGEPRPVADLLGAICDAAGVPAPARQVPTTLALVAGGVAQTVWSLRGRAGGRPDGDPPITRFVAEQLSTAHWFDQRHTRAVLGWAPRVSLDQGLAELRRAYVVEKEREG